MVLVIKKTIHIFSILLLAILPVAFSGCMGGGSETVAEEESSDLPEPLRVKKPFDYVYLKAFDAVDEMQDWDVDITNINRGDIVVRNNQYSRFDDSDMKVVRLKIRRIKVDLTEVAVAEGSSKVKGAQDILDYISNFIKETQL